MIRYLLPFLLFLSPLGFSEHVVFGPSRTSSSEVYLWYCAGCGLGYPLSSKTCLNKDCPNYKKPRQKK
jgi:hypothetical protein